MPSRLAARSASALLVMALVVLLAPASASAVDKQFFNETAITVPDNGNANPAPLEVTGLGGHVTDVMVWLQGVGHTRPDDFDILVVSPAGDKVIVTSDACGSVAVEDVNWLVADVFSTPMSDDRGCGGGFYAPTDYNDGPDAWPVAGPYSTSLAVFDGENANGTWRLYVRDDSPGEGGDLEKGWGLSISTGPYEAVIPASGTSGPAAPYPLTRAVSGVSGVITDVDVDIDGISHTHPDDLDMVLQAPGGETVALMANACGGFDVTNRRWIFDDEAPAQMADSSNDDVCNAPRYRPTNHDPGSSIVAPGPAGPYASALSAFDFRSPNGEWKLWIADDASGDGGFLVNQFRLDIKTRPVRPLSLDRAALDAPEGSQATVRVTRGGGSGYGPAKVRVRTVAGTASAGSDFTPIDFVIDFQTGSAWQDIAVPIKADGGGEPPERFRIELLEASGDAVLTAPSAATITIPSDPPPPGAAMLLPGGGGTTGIAAPYPAKSMFAGFERVVADVDVVLNDLTHAHPDDLDLMLEGPGGQTVMLMSDVCGSYDIGQFDVRFDDEALGELADEGTGDICPAGASYRPTNRPSIEPAMPPPAPPGPYGTSLAVFDGLEAAGEWRLWAFDDSNTAGGFLAQPFALVIATRPGAAVAFGADRATAKEDETLSLALTRSGNVLGPAAIRVRTSGGTATSGEDFTPVDQVVAFAAGEAAKQVDVPVAGGAGEPDEAFTVELLDPDGDARVGSPGVVTVAVPADPAPPGGPGPGGPGPAPGPGPGPGGAGPSPGPGGRSLSPFTTANAASLPSARRCRRARARLRLRPLEPQGIDLARTLVLVNGRKVADRKGARADDAVTLRTRGARTDVTMTLTATDGRKVTVRRAYRRCKPRGRRRAG